MPSVSFRLSGIGEEGGGERAGGGVGEEWDGELFTSRREGGGVGVSCTVAETRQRLGGEGEVPSCAWVMLLTIARPSPTPAWSVRRRSVPRRNGSASVATNCGVSFSPVFSTVSITLLG